jgi:hypothetical protein
MGFSCFEAIIVLMKDSLCLSCFVPGEEKLAIMTEYLNKIDVKPDGRKVYKAKDVVRFTKLDRFQSNSTLLFILYLRSDRLHTYA